VEQPTKFEFIINLKTAKAVLRGIWARRWRLQARLAQVEAEPDQDSERDLDEERIAKLLAIRRGRAYTVVVWLVPGLA